MFTEKDVTQKEQYMKPILCELTLPGSIRSKKNSRQPVPIVSKNKTRFMAWMGRGWKYVRVINLPSAAYRKWEKEAHKAIMAQLPAGYDPVAHTVEIHVSAYFKGKKPDLSGIYETVGDCLEGKVYLDDKQVDKWDGVRVHDKASPRTEIIVFDGSG